MQPAALTKHELYGFLDRRRHFLGAGIVTPARRLLDGEEDHQCQHQPGNAQHEEGRPPLVEMRDLPGEVGTQPGPDRRAQRKDGGRHRATRRGEIVGDDRVARRGATRLADPDPDPRQHQLEGRRDETADSGHHRPCRDGEGQQVLAVAPVGQPRHRQAHGDVEQPQRHPGEHPGPRFVQVKLQPNRLKHGRNDIAVGNAEGVDQHRDDQHVPAPEQCAFGRFCCC